MRRLERLTPMVALAGALCASPLAHGAPDAVTDTYAAAVDDYLKISPPPPPVAPPVPPAMAEPALKLSMGKTVDAKPDYEAALRAASARTGVPLDAARFDPKGTTDQAKVLSLDLEGLAYKSPNTANFLSDPDNANMHNGREPSSLDWWSDYSGQLALGLGVVAAAAVGSWVYRFEPKHAVRRLACVAGVGGLAVVPVGLSALGTPLVDVFETGKMELSAVIGALLFSAVLMIARAMRWVAAGIALDRQHQTDLG